MKVKAIADGYDGWQMRHPGDVFVIKDNQFSDVWMKKVAEDIPTKGAPSPAEYESSHVEANVEQPKKTSKKKKRLSL